ncbi:integral membrane sensor signal transduction histidine kinase [Acetivibrio thermocellus BC1]|nr:integral membrane sensor signal transduction histidine kinase [Acetivibrio thermocellus BC1]
MDTKWKNIKYSNITKVIVIFLAWLSFVCASESVFFVVTNGNTVEYASYYDYPEFISGFYTCLESVADYYIWVKDVDGPDDIMVLEDESIADKMFAYYNAKPTISGLVNFAYYIKNNTTGETFTNIKYEEPVELLKKQPTYTYIDRSHVQSMKPYKTSHVIEVIRKTEMAYEIHAAIIEPLKPGDKFYDDFVRFNRVKYLWDLMVVVFVVSSILFIGSLVFLFNVTWERIKYQNRNLAFIDKMHMDIYTLGVLILTAIGMSIFWNVSWDTLNKPSSTYTLGNIFIGVTVLSLIFIICLSCLLSFVRRAAKGKLRNSFLFVMILRKIGDFIKQLFSGKIFKGWILFFLFIYVAIDCILFTMFVDQFVNYGFCKTVATLVFLLVFINALVFVFTAKALRSLAAIIEGTEQISRGNLDYEMNIGKMSPVFVSFAQNISNIRGGLKKAVEEAIKGERMKTELITNVSHDLKTPLTSIINYVDLLKREEMGSRKAKEYIGILEEKSARLKVLIEDLVEASKASSGNLAVNFEKVDLHELVLQAQGEYQDKMGKSGLDIRISAEDNNIFVRADGRHMWRIIENLMSNVLKYSLQGSRVYIDITRNQTDGVLVIKNISATPLNIPVERLTERFVRGDEARTTEGSGLGLSIAQSLTTLQKGKFDIEIDGDLFKVIVQMPLWEASFIS